MNSEESKDNLERMLDVLYEFDYDGLTDDELDMLERAIVNELQTVRKIIRYNELDKHKNKIKEFENRWNRVRGSKE